MDGWDSTPWFTSGFASYKCKCVSISSSPLGQKSWWFQSILLGVSMEKHESLCNLVELGGGFGMFGVVFLVFIFFSKESRTWWEVLCSLKGPRHPITTTGWRQENWLEGVLSWDSRRGGSLNRFKNNVRVSGSWGLNAIQICFALFWFFFPGFSICPLTLHPPKNVCWYWSQLCLWAWFCLWHRLFNLFYLPSSVGFEVWSWCGHVILSGASPVFSLSPWLSRYFGQPLL